MRYSQSPLYYILRLLIDLANGWGLGGEPPQPPYNPNGIGIDAKNCKAS
jgi:hypothetical protein